MGGGEPVKSKGAGAAVIAGALGAYLIKRKNELRFYHYEIVNSKIPEAFEGFRILHLSDLHSKSYGNDGEYLVEACEEFNPDIIVFTGDLFSRSENIFTIKRKVPMMKKLNQLAPLYYVWGNHEADVPDKARLMNSRLSEEGITILRNEKVRIYSGESFIELYGLELDWQGLTYALPEKRTTLWLRSNSPTKSFASCSASLTPPISTYCWRTRLCLSQSTQTGALISPCPATATAV